MPKKSWDHLRIILQCQILQLRIGREHSPLENQAPGMPGSSRGAPSDSKHSPSTPTGSSISGQQWGAAEGTLTFPLVHPLRHPIASQCCGCLDSDKLHDTKPLADALIGNDLSRGVLPLPFTLPISVINNHPLRASMNILL